MQSENYLLEQKLTQAEEPAIQYTKILSMFPDMPITTALNLESRRYIGNKTKLRTWIADIIAKETNNYENCTSFFDVFAGTGCVAKSMFPFFEKVIVNDILHANNIIYTAFFANQVWDKNKILTFIDKYNLLKINELPDNYFSEQFGDKFFDYKNAKLIGYIRADIEQNKNNLNEKEYAILLATLIYNIDKIANTVGHFDAYIKKTIKYQRLYLKTIQNN